VRIHLRLTGYTKFRAMLGNMTKTWPRSRDRNLIQIVDAALAEVTRKSGSRLACRPGCTQCCVGPFRINQLDAARLRQGLRDLRKVDPERAQRVSKRAEDSIGRLSRDFPGDPITGVLDEGPLADEKFAEFANDEPCPVLDPETGLCDLYAECEMIPDPNGLEGKLLSQMEKKGGERGETIVAFCLVRP
jgi:hypothetical protein